MSHFQTRLLAETTLSMFYNGKAIRDTRQKFEKNNGQSLAVSNGARDKNT